ncbi:hypothetical protein [Lysobacter tyrosinilyticus]
MSTEISFEIVPVWKRVSAELSAELIDLWGRSQAIPDPARAAQRAHQAVCIARDPSGALCGVGTAVIRVLPRLRQPLYYYRQFFAPEFRGQKQAIPFFNEARRLLEQHNDSLLEPESLGMLLELESPQLVARSERAYEPAADSTFIGYSPRGLQLRVSYFKNARLLSGPVQLRASA